MIDRILRLKDVLHATGYSRPNIYRHIAAGTFPRPVSLGGNTVGWPESEVAAINAARIAAKSDDEIRDLIATLYQRRHAAA